MNKDRFDLTSITGSTWSILRLPPLRERREAIKTLAEHLLKNFCESAGLPDRTINDDAWPALMSYRWPGNVRQLQNAMERAAALSGASPSIGLADLPEEVREGASEGITPVLAGHRVVNETPGNRDS